MKTKALIGKTIHKIHQGRMVDAAGDVLYDITSIVFTDGTRLDLNAFETESGDDYGIDGTFVPAIHSSFTGNGPTYSGRLVKATQ